jgi:MoaA/NifB/PqqE/SkfB family radical SAM enzyme
VNFTRLGISKINYKYSKIIFGYRAKIINFGLLFSILLIAYKHFNKSRSAIEALKKLISNRKQIAGSSINIKYIKSGSRYFWDVDSPGWPSKSFDKFIKKELNSLSSLDIERNQLQSVIFAITNRCPFRCNHCFEWANLDSKDQISLEELKIVLSKIQDQEIYHIQLSGGEPLVRFNDMIDLMKSSKPDTDFWILTSGYGLNEEKALKLKEAGLIGVNISLDHWNETEHNSFRNNENSFQWVKKSVENCKKYGIIVSLSLCATKNFISEANLHQYVALAKDWNVDFIRILEPRKAGRFFTSDVELGLEQINILEKFYLEINSNPKYNEFPKLSYPGYYQNKIGCLGAGNRYFYIDSLANIHACPFCPHKQGNALTDSIDIALQRIRQKKCHYFKMNEII